MLQFVYALCIASLLTLLNRDALVPQPPLCKLIKMVTFALLYVTKLLSFSLFVSIKIKTSHGRTRVGLVMVVKRSHCSEGNHIDILKHNHEKSKNSSSYCPDGFDLIRKKHM